MLTAAGPAAATTLPGSWRTLPKAPLPSNRMGQLTSVWTGSQMIVFGRAGRGPGGIGPYLNMAAAHTPATGGWRRLHPPNLPGGSGGYEGGGHSVWTGTEMLVTALPGWGYAPRTGRWRQRALDGVSPISGVVVWTGEEMVGWGGGCCGESSNAGSAFDPVTNATRSLATAPLAPRQTVAGAWTGTELIVAGGADADGHTFRDAAAYNPCTDAWRRIAPLPTRYRGTITAWTGREMLLVGGSPRAGVGFAYDPRTDRWRTLPRMSGDNWWGGNSVSVWTGRRLLVFGGQVLPSRPGARVAPARGVAYTPATNRWSSLPASPLTGNLRDLTAVWTGRQMLVWTSSGSGAAFRPRTP